MTASTIAEGFAKELFQLAPDGHFVTDHDGVIRRVNLAATTLLSGGDESLVGRSLESFAPEPECRTIRNELDRLRRPPELAHDRVMFDARLQTLDGRTFHAGMTVAVIGLGPAGESVLHWAVRDITPRKHLEEDLRQSEARLRAILETAFSGMMTIDEQGHIESFNSAAERMFGYLAGEAVGRHISALVPSVRSDGDLTVNGECILGSVRDLAGRRRDGAEFPTELSVSETRVNGRRFFTAIVRDVSELRWAQERAVQAERLAAIGQMVTGLAHESRNAFQRCQAALEMLEARVADRPEARALLTEIQDAQDHLHRLYEEVRSYSAPIRLDARECHLADAWRNAWAHLSTLRAGRRTELREESDVTASACDADPFRMEQVFRNVLENSLAACPDPVVVTVRCEEARVAGLPAVRVSVCDNGPGLSAEQRQNIFDPFFTTKTKGTGLGMAIAKRIVEAHGGRIEVVELDCPGAEIIITLPRRKR